MTGLWVLATPGKKTYSGMSRNEAIQTYQKMAYEEFDKQFEHYKDSEKIEKRKLYTVGRSQGVADSTMILLQISKWHKNLVCANLCSLVYTMNEYPQGEATNVTLLGFTADVSVQGWPIAENDIHRDLKEFYKKFGWKAKTVEIETDPQKTHKELDYLVLPTLAEVFKYGRNR